MWQMRTFQNQHWMQLKLGGEVHGKSQVGKKGAGPGRPRVKGKETGGVTKQGKSGGGEEMTRKLVKGRKPGAKVGVRRRLGLFCSVSVRCSQSVARVGER